VHLLNCVRACCNLEILLIDDNKISGLGKKNVGKGYTAEFCDTTPYLGKAGSVFTSDCGGQIPELECPCCTECCDDDTPCNDDTTLLANHDLIWEHGYNRLRYVFNNATIYERIPV